LDREEAYRPARESRLVALDNLIESTALNRVVKRYGHQSPAGILASSLFRPLQARQSTLLSIKNTERIYDKPIAGALPIRSPPLPLPL
jgi:hypothetical protein